MKKRPKVIPRKKAPPKRKVVVRRKPVTKAPPVRKAKPPVRKVVRRTVRKQATHRKAVVARRAAPRRAQPQRRAHAQQNRRPVNRNKATVRAKPVRRRPVRAVRNVKPRPAIRRPPVKKPVRAVKPKPVVRRPPAKPRVVGNPRLEKQYEQGIRQRIEQKKVYPRRAKRMRKQGVVKVAFTVSKNGTVSKLRLLKSSGVKSLDKAALEAVRKVGRFPPIPAGVGKALINYIIPIAYRLR